MGLFHGYVVYFVYDHLYDYIFHNVLFIYSFNIEHVKAPYSEVQHPL